MNTSLSDINEEHGNIDAECVGSSVSQNYLQKNQQASILKN